MIQDIQTTDARLLEAWKLRQDREALAMLVERYANLVMGVCCRQCRQRSDAEDAFQITLLILARSAHSIRSATTLPAWLHTTAMRVASRIRNQRETESIDEETLPDERTDFLQQLALRHELQILDEELQQLDEGTRLPILLHYIEGKKVVDIAEEMDITPRAVRGKLQRGRQELQRRLILRGVSVGAVLAAVHSMDLGTIAAASAQEAVCRIHTHPENFSPRPTSDPASGDLSFLSSTKSDIFQQGLIMKSLYLAITGSLALAVAANRYDDQPSQGQADDSTFAIEFLPDTVNPPIAFQLAQTTGPNNYPPPLNGPQFDSSIGSSSASPVLTNPEVSGDDGPGIGDTGGNYPGMDGPGIPGIGGPGMGGAGGNYPGMGGFGGGLGGGAGMGFPGQGINGMNGNATAETNLDGAPDGYSDYERDYILDRLRSSVEADDVFSATSVQEFAEVLQEKLNGIPVVLSVPEKLEGIEMNLPLSLAEGDIALEMAIKQALRPCNLRTVVRDDAIMIVPDTVALARQGIGTSKYANVDDEAVREFEKILETTTIDIPANEGDNTEPTFPLNQLIQMLAKQASIEIEISNFSLEDLGLNIDLPVTLSPGNYTLDRLLKKVGRDLEIALLPHDDHLVLTTFNEAENPSNFPIRVYWLDATGLNPNDARNTIEISIHPESWETTGGPGTIQPVKIPGSNKYGRYGIVVSTSWNTHREIEKLLQTFRDGNMDPYAQEEWSTDSATPGMSGMGGGMGGMF